MASPIKYLDSSLMMGSWPVIPQYVGGSPVLLPGVLDLKATLLGARREPAAGYDIGSRSFRLILNGVTYTVSFNAGNKTLQEVIDVINSAGGAPGSVAPPIPGPDTPAAFRDNGFLRIEASDTLSLEADPASTPTDILFQLGLFPGLESSKGDIQQTQHLDPERQVMLPKQLSMGEGENLEARAINRMALQLSTNIDRQEGLLSRKRIAGVKETGDVTYAHTVGDPGHQMSGGEHVFVGISPQTVSEFEKHFAVLTPDGSEITVSEETSSGVLSCEYFPASEGNMLRCLVASPGYFLPTDTTGNVYFRVANIADTAGGSESDLNGSLLKVVQYLSDLEVLAVPVVESSASSEDAGRRVFLGGGDEVLLPTAGGHTTERVVIAETKVVVTDVKDGPLGASVVSQASTRGSFAAASMALSRVELGSRIVIDSAALGFDFISEGVSEGDTITWANHSAPSHDNNGTYRVHRIIDKESIELLSSDWGAPILNPDLSVPGDITVTTDGEFYKDPYISFNVRPDTNRQSSDFNIVYKGMTTLRDAMDNPSLFGTAGSLRYKQESSDLSTRIMKSIIGPSAKDLSDEQLTYFEDQRFSMEDLYARIQTEHWDHREVISAVVPPDGFNVFQTFPGATSTVIQGSFFQSEDFSAVNTGDLVTLGTEWPTAHGTYVVTRVDGTSFRVGVVLPAESQSVGTPITFRRAGPVGGHKDIRPRTIEMDDHIEGLQFSMGSSESEGPNAIKVELRDTDKAPYFRFFSSGEIRMGGDLGSGYYTRVHDRLISMEHGTAGSLLSIQFNSPSQGTSGMHLFPAAGGFHIDSRGRVGFRISNTGEGSVLYDDAPRVEGLSDRVWVSEEGLQVGESNSSAAFKPLPKGIVAPGRIRTADSVERTTLSDSRVTHGDTPISFQGAPMSGNASSAVSSRSHAQAWNRPAFSSVVAGAGFDHLVTHKNWVIALSAETGNERIGRWRSDEGALVQDGAFIGISQANFTYGVAGIVDGIMYVATNDATNLLTVWHRIDVDNWALLDSTTYAGTEVPQGAITDGTYLYTTHLSTSNVRKWQIGAPIVHLGASVGTVTYATLAPPKFVGGYLYLSGKDFGSGFAEDSWFTPNFGSATLAVFVNTQSLTNGSDVYDSASDGFFGYVIYRDWVAVADKVAAYNFDGTTRNFLFFVATSSIGSGVEVDDRNIYISMGAAANSPIHVFDKLSPSGSALSERLVSDTALRGKNIVLSGSFLYASLGDHLVRYPRP